MIDSELDQYLTLARRVLATRIDQLPASDIVALAVAVLQLAEEVRSLDGIIKETSEQ